MDAQLVETTIKTYLTEIRSPASTHSQVAESRPAKWAYRSNLQGSDERTFSKNVRRPYLL